MSDERKGRPSASSFERHMNCRPSFRLAEKLPRLEIGGSQLGTETHDYIANPIGPRLELCAECTGTGLIGLDECGTCKGAGTRNKQYSREAIESAEYLMQRHQQIYD